MSKRTTRDLQFVNMFDRTFPDAREVSMADQANFFGREAGIAHNGKHDYSSRRWVDNQGRGRGSVVFDRTIGSMPLSLKAFGKKHTTADISTGRSEHVQAVLDGIKNYPIFMVVWGYQRDNNQFGVINVSRVYREYGVIRQTSGQGKRTDLTNPHALRMGTTKRLSGGKRTPLREIEYGRLVVPVSANAAWYNSLEQAVKEGVGLIG